MKKFMFCLLCAGFLASCDNNPSGTSDGGADTMRTTTPTTSNGTNDSLGVMHSPGAGSDTGTSAHMDTSGRGGARQSTADTGRNGNRQ